MKDYKEYMNKITDKLKQFKHSTLGVVFRTTITVLLCFLALLKGISCGLDCNSRPKTAYAEQSYQSRFNCRSLNTNAIISNIAPAGRHQLSYMSTNNNPSLRVFISIQTIDGLVQVQCTAQAYTTLPSGDSSFIVRSGRLNPDNTTRLQPFDYDDLDTPFVPYVVFVSGSQPTVNSLIEFTGLHISYIGFDTALNQLLYDTKIMALNSYQSVNLWVARYTYTFSWGDAYNDNFSVVIYEPIYIYKSMPMDVLEYDYSSSSLSGVDSNSNYYAGYRDGYDIAKDEWYNKGKDESTTEAYNNGKSDGEKLGFERGVNTSLKDVTPFQMISQGVTSFMSIELIPNVSVSFLLSVMFGFSMVVLIIRRL